MLKQMGYGKFQEKNTKMIQNENAFDNSNFQLLQHTGTMYPSKQMGMIISCLRDFSADLPFAEPFSVDPWRWTPPGEEGRDDVPPNASLEYEIHLLKASGLMMQGFSAEMYF